MTEEENKAIEYFTKRIDICNENANICDENDFDEEATQLREEKRQTEIILNLIKSQQKEIEILKSKRVNMFEQLDCIDKKNKIIDLILEEIAFNYEINSSVDIVTIKRQLKEKFEKKVEGK